MTHSTPTDLYLELRLHARHIFAAGVQAADPYRAVCNSLASTAQRLGFIHNRQQPQEIHWGTWSKVHLIAFGKAAWRMAQAAQQCIPTHLLDAKQHGVVVTNAENLPPEADPIHPASLTKLMVMAAGHPIPDVRGLRAAQQVAQIARSAQAQELVLTLISGGGSALLPAPRAEITFQDKLDTTALLLASGADIEAINCVRKHLSTLKGGGLTKLAYPAQLHALVLSDVLTDDVSSIASGPTVADNSTYADALAVVQRYALWPKLPIKVRELLAQGAQGLMAETPKPADPIFATSSYTLVGSNRLSVDAALHAAQALGYQVKLYSTQLSGEARVVAEQLAHVAKQRLITNLKQPLALIAGGETTVTLKGTGKGGRNQEFALAFALAAERYSLPGAWVLLSGGTDGRDGPTDAAGGLITSQTLSYLRAQGIDAQALLDNNDSYHALHAADALLITAATGTNVADLQLLLLKPT